MRRGFSLSSEFDAIDLAVLGGFACFITGVSLEYGAATGLMAFGLGLMGLGGLAIWRRS